MVAAALPLVVFAYRAIRDGAHPVFDDALIALRTHDVLSTHPPTVGAGTRYGLISLEARANHPGPLPYVLLAPIYGLSGFRPAGLVVAVTTYHLAAVALVAHLARRIGGTTLLVAAMGAVLLVERALGGDVFTRPWNPYLALLPFLAFLFAAWAALADRTPGALGWAALTGSLAVQAQATFAASVAVVGGVTATVVVVRLVVRRRRGEEAPLRPLLVAGAVGLVAWILPLAQQVTADDGNLGRLLRWALGDPASGATPEAIGLRRGVEMAVQVAGRILPPTVDLSTTDGGLLSGPPSAAVWLGALVVVGLLATVVVVGALRPRPDRDPAPRASADGVDRTAAAGAGLALVVLGLGALVAGRATPEAAVSPYQVASLWIGGAFALAVLVATAARAAGAELARRTTPPVPAGGPRTSTTSGRAIQGTVAIAVVVLVALSASSLRETSDVILQVQEDRYAPTVEAAVDAIRAGDDPDGPYLVACEGTARLSLCGTAILALETRGVRTLADPDATALYGPDQEWRMADPDDELPTLVVASGRWLVPPTPDAELVTATLHEGLRTVTPPPGDTTLPAQDAAFDAAAAALATSGVEVVSDDLYGLHQTRRDQGLLALEVDGAWFRGQTVEEWQALIDDDPDRFVRGGGLAALAAVGALDDHPDLAAHAEALAALPDGDAVWLLPPGPPRGPRE